MDSHFDHQRDWRIKTVDGHFALCGHLRQGGNRFNRFNRRTTRMFEDKIGNAIQMSEIKFLHHFNQAAVANLIACRQRIDVTNQLIRFAHITPDDPRQCRIHLASVSEFPDGDVEPLFINAMRIRTKTAPTDIHDMRGAGKKSDQNAVVKRRRYHRDVMKMTRAFPWIIGDIDVALKNVLTSNAADEMGNRIRHRIDMARCAGHGLGQHVALGVINARG
nr:hypothetical protein [Roseobacter litoralis]